MTYYRFRFDRPIQFVCPHCPNRRATDPSESTSLMSLHCIRFFFCVKLHAQARWHGLWQPPSCFNLPELAWPDHVIRQPGLTFCAAGTWNSVIVGAEPCQFYPPHIA